MEISKRLQTVAEQIKQCNTIADIGTDHGYVPIYLYNKGIINKAIACDINEGPLKRADNNIKLYGAGEAIETRLGSGLCPVKTFEADAAVIAGMGGMLIIDILKDSLETVKSLKQLVLQPQLDISSVRRYIHGIGFKIDNEEMIIDEGKYYTIISAVYGEEKYCCDNEYTFGKVLIEKKNPVLKKYIEYKIQKQIKLMAGLKKINTLNSNIKLKEITEENKMYKEVYECL